MYYGNAQITSATETPGAVLDAGYVGVWHLGETGNGAVNEYRDSSAFANHGRGGKGVAAAVPARVDGKIGYAQNFGNGDGTYDFIDAGSDGTLNISGQPDHAARPGCGTTSWSTPPTARPRPPSVPYGILAHKGWDDGYSLWLHGRRRPVPGQRHEALRHLQPPGPLVLA